MIGAGLIVLPTLPLPQWTGAADAGPMWAPHVESWLIGLLVVAVVGMLIGRLSLRLAPTRWRWPSIGTPLLVGTLAVLLTALSAYTMRSVFADNPHLVDGMAQLFHARVFAAGRLAAPPPEPAQAFLITHTWITDAGWVSQFPPGQTVLLALGLLLHAEWLVNPILGGLGVVLVYFAARGLYGDATAKVAAFLWAASAWVMFVSATYSSHVGATTFTLVAWALLWGPRSLHSVHLVGVGLALAGATATRPLDGIAAALPIIVWFAVRREWRRMPWLVAGLVPVAVGWAYLNWQVYGNPLTLGYSVLWGSEVGLGFHTDPSGEPFTPFIALSNAAVALRRLNIFLFEWPIPALLPLALWAIVARHRRSSDLLVAIGVAAAPILYFFYWHSGFYLGPRFYYAATPMIVIGTARAWQWGWLLARRASARLLRWDVALAAAAAMVLFWGWFQILPRRFDVYRTGLVTMKLHPEERLQQMRVRQALVLVPESWGSRVVVGLWGLGVSPGLVERAYRRLDTCELYHFLGDARAANVTPKEVSDQLELLVERGAEAPPRLETWPDPTIRLRTEAALTEDCRKELDRDLRGFTLYGYLAWRNAVGLSSGVVFARDMYEENGALLARYVGWELWRFAPEVSARTAPPVLTRVGVVAKQMPD